MSVLLLSVRLSRLQHFFRSASVYPVCRYRVQYIYRRRTLEKCLMLTAFKEAKDNRFTTPNEKEFYPCQSPRGLDQSTPRNSTIPHTLSESAPVLPQSLRVMMNNNQNVWPENQMREDIVIDIPLKDEFISDVDEIDEVYLNETSVIKNWYSLMNDDLETLIPEYDCVSTSKVKEQSESVVQLELEVTLTPKIDDVNKKTNQIPQNEPNNNNINNNIIQELPKTISPPVVDRMPSVIQRLVTNSYNSSPLSSTPSLSISSLLQSPLESNIPNDFSFMNTISNISSAPSDRPVHNAYVSSIKSQVSSSSSGSSTNSGRSSLKQPPSDINLERSYQICQAVFQNIRNLNQRRCQLKPPPPAVLIDKSSILRNGPKPIRNINITSNSQPLVVRHVFASSRGIPVTMSVGPPYTSVSSAMSQGGSLKNSAGHDVPPPPLVDLLGNTAPVMGNTVSFANGVPFNQCMTTMYNPMANSNMISHSNQMGQLYSQCAINNSQLQLKQQQQQQQMSTPRIQQSYSGHSDHSRMTNTQLHSQLRNVGPIIITPKTAIIDLSSSKSSPIPPTVQKTSHRPIYRYDLMRIPERNRANNKSTAAYKIQKLKFHGIIIDCINYKPYVMTCSSLLVALDDLVQILFPSCTVTRCAHIFQNQLKISLFSGNSEQLAVLRKNRPLRSIHPEDTPMAFLTDIGNKWNTLQILVMQEDQNIYQFAGGPSKRHCTR